jgi:hypothetical protein
MKTNFSFLLVILYCVLGLEQLACLAASPAAEYFIYLPMTSNFTTSNLSVVANGDFEAGRVEWVEFEDSIFFDFPLIVNKNDLPSPIIPYQGDWVAWLGGESDLVSYIEQVITIPQSKPELTFWHWIDSIWGCEDSTFGGIFLGGTLVDQFSLCLATATGGWVEHTVDLSTYAGQTVTLRILSQTGTDNFSSLYIDAVSVHSSQ